MKKTILALAILFTVFAQAQYFKLTPAGFVSEKETTKKYVVVEFADQTKEQIFKDVLISLNKKYVSTKDVLSIVENETITINAIGKKIRRTSLHAFKNDYTIVLAFKDGKMKIEAPVFELTSYSAGHLQQLHLTYRGLSLDGSHFGIYKKSGKVKYSKAEEDLNEFANNFVKDLISKKNNNEDW